MWVALSKIVLLASKSIPESKNISHDEYMGYRDETDDGLIALIVGRFGCSVFCYCCVGIHLVDPTMPDNE